jgi:hypothetical protein
MRKPQLKTIIFIALCLFVIAVRLPQLATGTIVFLFDQGKDALAVMHMWLTMSPKFIGPWTSIPGLYFGPAWYYLLLPGMIISGGNPIASVVTMVLIGLVTLYFVHRYFGLLAAVLFGLSNVFFTITTSAWNPFPMVLLSVLILGKLQKIEQKMHLTWQDASLLGVFSGLGFHFSSAFAIFYPALIAASVLIKRIKPPLASLIAYPVAFAATFIPQLLFEIKNGFLQAKAIMAYFQQGSPGGLSLDSFTEVWFIFADELRSIIQRTTIGTYPVITQVIGIASVAAFLVALYYFMVKKPQVTLKYDLVLWIVIPLLAFPFLHMNVWYVLPIFPVFILLVAAIFRAAPKPVLIVFLAVVFLSEVSRVVYFYETDREFQQGHPAFLPATAQAIEYIYHEAGGRPFASYHYEPAIFDFKHQYMYFKGALEGRTLPTEFSYQPAVAPYIGEKDELLQAVSGAVDAREPEVIFYILENDDGNPTLEAWWNAQSYGEIINTHRLSEFITIYTATPK